ncbi:MAG TPA: hypothetical protein VFL47_04960 [Flavisolibacter sp.]|nr:hypothetical protein [Flavisolibacter sp.]
MRSLERDLFYFMPPTAYTATPLAKKLGLKDGYTVRLHGEPEYYRSLFTDWPAVVVENNPAQKKNLVHFFTKDAEELHHYLPLLKEEIVDNGILWISWPKKASKVPTDLTEDVIRQLALANGLVDVKVCAIDAVWSGLKLVIPVKNRVQKDNKRI